MKKLLIVPILALIVSQFCLAQPLFGHKLQIFGVEHDSLGGLLSPACEAELMNYLPTSDTILVFTECQLQAPKLITARQVVKLTAEEKKLMSYYLPPVFLDLAEDGQTIILYGFDNRPQESKAVGDRLAQYVDANNVQLSDVGTLEKFPNYLQFIEDCKVFTRANKSFEAELLKLSTTSYTAEAYLFVGAIHAERLKLDYVYLDQNFGLVLTVRRLYDIAEKVSNRYSSK